MHATIHDLCISCAQAISLSYSLLLDVRAWPARGPYRRCCVFAHARLHTSRTIRMCTSLSRSATPATRVAKSPNASYLGIPAGCAMSHARPCGLSQNWVPNCCPSGLRAACVHARLLHALGCANARTVPRTRRRSLFVRNPWVSASPGIHQRRTRNGPMTNGVLCRVVYRIEQRWDWSTSIGFVNISAIPGWLCVDIREGSEAQPSTTGSDVSVLSSAVWLAQCTGSAFCATSP
ncbi:uncharacterized protein B0H18DRAFT_339288 [Fomitopsis serialis]|uniref:uncharacterized protein n=1 Tax=Fomitopsis serialis TaxID=139415 RepID=UPI002007C2D7|nr:uncharacterized protein B0H18DRAFT_339288 [Neoantrodia serialis]KAH9926368.1 hypothetical protein B0H18DRAFT_339288 [Neoantrodia serialis]